jgi:hypothetical protein
MGWSEEDEENRSGSLHQVQVQVQHLARGQLQTPVEGAGVAAGYLGLVTGGEIVLEGKDARICSPCSTGSLALSRGFSAMYRPTTDPGSR